MRSMRHAAVLAIAFVCVAAGHAQSSLQPTEPPAVTADTQNWYSTGEPIAFGGAVYFPSGPISHFLRNEMVQAGSFDGVPIYTRTTVERGSLIYVPLAGGVMRPYERRRSGALAGTSGSTAPSFPVVLPTDTARQAAEPPVVRTPGDMLAAPVGLVGANRPAATAPEPVGTAGTVLTTVPPSGPSRMQTVRRPVGLNDVFVQFERTRWFAAGPAVEIAADRFDRIGEYHGFPVYRQRGSAGTIYVALTADAPALLSPYAKR